MSKLTLLSPTDYVAQATESINNARERVVLLSMIIADHSQTHEMIDALLVAAKRGVAVYVAADIFTYGEISGSFLPIKYYSKPSRNATNMGKLLKEAGVKFHWLGRSTMTIFNGRTHSKWCIVDSTVYTFGGVNMYDAGVENADYMFFCDSSELADRLFKEYQQLVQADRNGRLYNSRRIPFNDDHVLIDGGILGNSIIYKRACELASQADKITFLSQYPPTGKLAKILKTRKTTFYFNSPENASFVNRMTIRYSMLISNIATRYKRLRYIHAKAIIFYMADGSRIAVTGSHNFNYSTVFLGTREIALETKDPEVIDQLETFIKNEIV